MPTQLVLAQTQLHQRSQAANGLRDCAKQHVGVEPQLREEGQTGDAGRNGARHLVEAQTQLRRACRTPLTEFIGDGASQIAAGEPIRGCGRAQVEAALVKRFVGTRTGPTLSCHESRRVVQDSCQGQHKHEYCPGRHSPACWPHLPLSVGETRTTGRVDGSGAHTKPGPTPVRGNQIGATPVNQTRKTNKNKTQT